MAGVSPGAACMCNGQWSRGGSVTVSGLSGPHPLPTLQRIALQCHAVRGAAACWCIAASYLGQHHAGCPLHAGQLLCCDALIVGFVSRGYVATTACCLASHCTNRYSSPQPLEFPQNWQCRQSAVLRCATLRSDRRSMVTTLHNMPSCAAQVAA